jgi:hypothetical protein
MAQVNPAHTFGKAALPPVRRVPLGPFLRSAGPSLALGLLTTALLQAIARLPAPAPASFDASPAGRITWSALVCVSLGLATTVVRRRVVAMATTGLLGAPLAFILARVARRGSVNLLRALEGGAPSPLLLGALKGIEYGCLGLALGWIGQRESRAITYAAVGLATGVVFGIANFLVALGTSPDPFAAPELLAWLVNEVLFPVGCALVIWNVDRCGQTARGRIVTADKDLG